MSKQMPAEYYKQSEELQSIDFVILELTLYLDTHPQDHMAIDQYDFFVKQRKTFVKQFEKQFGPLTSFGYSYARGQWQWHEAPWPWQV